LRTPTLAAPIQCRECCGRHCRRYTQCLPDDFVFDLARLEPANTEQVAEGFKQAVPDAVMALAGEPRVRRDRYFGHRESFHLDQSREKAVRALEEFHVGDAFSFKDAIGAAGIADVFA